jgi:hypothetical protein
VELLERDGALATLIGAACGDGRVVFVTGEPGIWLTARPFARHDRR